MSGNPDKASIWGDADVFVTHDLEADNPATIDDPFPATWDLVGLLDGEAGFEESRSRDTSDYFAWGGLLIRTARRNFVLTRKFVALEENAVTLGLVWPGSGLGERRIPKADKFKIGFQTEDGAKTKRVISRRHAEVEEVGTIKDSESELTKLEITVKIYPDAEGVLFDVQPDTDNVTLDSLSIEPATVTLDALGAFQPLVVTATYSDATTRVVSAAAVYSSDTPAVAPVDRGYVEAVAEGGAVVTVTYGGKSATVDVLVDVTP